MVSDSPTERKRDKLKTIIKKAAKRVHVFKKPKKGQTNPNESFNERTLSSRYEEMPPYAAPSTIKREERGGMRDEAPGHAKLRKKKRPVDLSEEGKHTLNDLKTFGCRAMKGGMDMHTLKLFSWREMEKIGRRWCIASP
ncbi:hypothetical protein M409DRAFT_27056 [Zasmidium cellare ATCC 36951]|uniref:Uncharacterized protein n=1 Tax=Zasmidium cellare ATCC 36951 TaxID=1080233 RepID=A0A6A6C949_ZASCE|nr:uncharacterized protein M409DRAFT_27056 [Zasmidium cellare ATCC 36951]KAF2162432.1 hypothetical protein M409DRAFT_27056 [Zasmidium cellare ATCC 36951]